MSTGESSVAGRSQNGARQSEAPSTKERITVNLTGKGAAALADLVGRTGDSKTDVINRALILYDYFESIMGEGGAVFVREAGAAETERVRFL
ncbi:hypothetical protein [Spirillospora sp. NPDC029432]|uniref:hypothetical protein n=1 Tax=Spirillospora sp. NPDC029432 TaxID=3154599 RepID=UPI00345126C9